MEESSADLAPVWDSRTSQALGVRETAWPAQLSVLSKFCELRLEPTLPGFVNSLKPARLENKHVQLPRRTILAAGPAAFTGLSV